MAIEKLFYFFLFWAKFWTIYENVDRRVMNTFTPSHPNSIKVRKVPVVDHRAKFIRRIRHPGPYIFPDRRFRIRNSCVKAFMQTIFINSVRMNTKVNSVRA